MTRWRANPRRRNGAGRLGWLAAARHEHQQAADQRSDKGILVRAGAVGLEQSVCLEPVVAQAQGNAFVLNDNRVFNLEMVHGELGDDT